MKNFFGGIIDFGKDIAGKTGAMVNAAAGKTGSVITAAARSKRAWTMVFTLGLKMANRTLRIIDDTLMSELAGLAATAIVSESIRPMGAEDPAPLPASPKIAGQKAPLPDRP